MTVDPVTYVAFVDDDDDLRAALSQSLEIAGLHVLPFASAAAALQRLDAEFPGVVVSDIRMPGLDGRQLFERVRQIDPDLPVILITGHADVADAVEAMKTGAYDFLAKPFAAERLVGAVRRAGEKRSLVLENRRLKAEAERGGASPLIGESGAARRLRASIEQLAGTDADVLIEGETGVGKELVARLVHGGGRRRTRPFATLDCGALPAELVESELFGHEMGAFQGALRRRVGRIEAAQGGTLFIDEIETASPAVQAKLLRVLAEREVWPLGSNEPRPVDVRVIAASKADLAELATAGLFRADLFHRLNVVRIEVPPLRNRREDVSILFAHFAYRAAARLRRPAPPLSEAVRRRLLEHAWPGNIRELANFAERVVLGADDLTRAEEEPHDESLADRVARYEADLIRSALKDCQGDVRAALERLRIPRKTFYDKLQRHGIEPSTYRDRRRR